MNRLGGSLEKEIDNFNNNRGHDMQSKGKRLSNSQIGVDQRDWVEVDQMGCPMGVHRGEWMTKLCGYSHDLDWSIDDFKSHPQLLLLAIKEKMAAKFEYRGGLGDVLENVFFKILRHQMRTKRANVKKALQTSGKVPSRMKEHHLKKFKNVIERTDKIAYAKWMKVV